MTESLRLVNPPAIVRHVDANLLALDQRIDQAEGDGIRARWEFGRALLRERIGKLLPRGRLDELVELTGKSRSELQYRVQFAERYPDEEELSNAVGQFGSWHEIVHGALPDRGAYTSDRPTIEPPPAPEGEYQIIYADPPWRYELPGGSTPQLRSVERHYPTMPDEEIAELEVPAAEHSICFLWATNPKLREALHVLAAWGFEYRTNLAWFKDRIGMGYYVRGQHELLLIGKRGDFPTPPENARPPSVLSAPREAHSAKPAAVYELIEEMYPWASRIELFARGQRLGWERWGAAAV